MTKPDLTERDLKIVDFDIAYMVENYEHARLHEGMRAQMTAITLSLSGIVLAAAVALPSPLVLIVFGLIIFALGVFGSRFSWKHYERFKFHVAVARVTRSGIQDRLDHHPEYRSIAEASRLGKEGGDGRLAPYSPQLLSAYRRRLYRFWLSLHRSQILLGTVLVILGVVWWMVSGNVSATLGNT